MKLVLYSGGDNIQNELIDELLVSLLPSNPKISYIPSNSTDYELYYKEVLDYYRKYSITNINPFFADRNYMATDLESLLQSDAIYLSGGNTYYFLNSLKSNNLILPLIEFVKQGGVLIGVSAGSLIQCPSIDLAGIPSFDCDINEVGLTNFTSMSLVSFEFMPHYPNLPDYDSELLEYSQTTENPIIACPDGSGVVITDNSTYLMGDVTLFSNGRKSSLGSLHNPTQQ